MTVVVEGVETTEQLELLTSLEGIEQIQGFLFSRPLTADHVPAALTLERISAKVA